MCQTEGGGGGDFKGIVFPPPLLCIPQSGKTQFDVFRGFYSNFTGESGVRAQKIDYFPSKYNFFLPPAVSHNYLCLKIYFFFSEQQDLPFSPYPVYRSRFYGSQTRKTLRHPTSFRVCGQIWTVCHLLVASLRQSNVLFL